MMFFVVVAYIKPVLYMENRLIQYNISRNVSFNILSPNDWLVNISYEMWGILNERTAFSYELFISIYF